MPHRLLVTALIALTLSCYGKREGGSCDDNGDCIDQLECVEGRCSIAPKFHEQMARQSGVKVSTERAASVAVPGAVAVRRGQAKDFAYALCGEDERLISGWCDPMSDGSGDSTDVTEMDIGGHTKTDTIGAQWKCFLRSERITAYALCQKIPRLQDDGTAAPADAVKPAAPATPTEPTPPAPAVPAP